MKPKSHLFKILGVVTLVFYGIVIYPVAGSGPGWNSACACYTVEQGFLLDIGLPINMLTDYKFAEFKPEYIERRIREKFPVGTPKKQLEETLGEFNKNCDSRDPMIYNCSIPLSSREQSAGMREERGWNIRFELSEDSSLKKLDAHEFFRIAPHG